MTASSPSSCTAWRTSRPARRDAASYPTLAVVLCRYSLDSAAAADAIEAAVAAVLDAGWRTADIASAGATTIGTREMGERVLEALDNQENQS